MQPSRTPQRIAVVDDDPSIRETLEGFLEAEGYEICCAADADELDRMMRVRPVDLVLLDIRLPGRDGLSLTRDLREKSEMGIILITGRNDKVDRILGLEYGADDYIAKPIDERELLPRVRNLLRRVEHSRSVTAPSTLSFGQFRLDTRGRSLTDPAGASVPLTTAEFDLLLVFVRNAGQAMSRERLISAIKRRRFESMDRTVDTLVRRLRRKIEADPDNPQLIKTVHGTGYLFTGRVAADDSKPRTQRSTSR
ncbi:response regulator transcription factor [Paraburkholderia hospita]|uniref:response regulator transcription factor n=1 Tax=Paraburkholderia hospita TaxID=169430 RepID=UPI000B342531|nr:response regulator transcription factor [Paraburkholderia hospita]OUL73886.1 DNA-binding response regulator [Paraburkholderia hospita]OUL84615.1 DNA-binding response regulator [Paraburkholderia hospita]